MGMIDSKHRIPTLAETNALKEAAKTGSLRGDGGAAFRAEIEKLQARLPSAPDPNIVIDPAQRQFQTDIETIQTVADSTTNTEINLLATATKSALLYLAGRK